MLWRQGQTDPRLRSADALIIAGSRSVDADVAQLIQPPICLVIN